MTTESWEKLYANAVAIVREEGCVSVAMIQRRFALRYSLAADVVDRMVREEVVGRSDPGSVRCELRPRAGDAVRHREKGYTLLVSAVRGEEFIAAGWPESIDRIADFEITERCTDEEHAEMLRTVIASGSVRGSWCRVTMERMPQAFMGAGI